jgi:hypothetical protein
VYPVGHQSCNAERITNLFLTLEIQFPVTWQCHEPILKNAQE